MLVAYSLPAHLAASVTAIPVLSVTCQVLKAGDNCFEHHAANSKCVQSNKVHISLPLMLCKFWCRQAVEGSPAASTSYVHANAEAMPVDDQSQDMVASSYLVHELPAHGTHGFLREAHRVLKPGGVLAIVDGDPW